MIYESESGDLTVTMAGDTMLTRRLSVYDEPDFLKVAELFRGADVGFVNLEGSVRHWDEGAPGITQGTFMTTPPALLDDLKWFGVNMVSCANNHAFDYGDGGMMATIRHLDNSGIVHAGTGANLAEARALHYLDTPHGRIGLVAATGTYRPWNVAGAQRPDMPGRPGINPIGSKHTYQVDAEAFAQLERMHSGLGFDVANTRARSHFFSEKEIPPDAAGRIDLFGNRFVRGKGFAASSDANEGDLADNLKWIGEAKRQADWVIFSFHFHEFGGESFMTAKTKTALEDPADFVKDVAHQAIDAGADIFVGHGSHTPLGVEIYKGRPIFYSVGNFIFQNETVQFFPDEAYRRFDLGPEATPADFLDARTDGGRKGHPAHSGFWENIVVQCKFRKDSLSEIRAFAVDQGYGRPRAQRGRPVLAAGDMAKRVLGRLARISERYGTEMRVTGHSAVIRLEGGAAGEAKGKNPSVAPRRSKARA